MDYEIVDMYTEKLHVSTFNELVEKGKKIDLLVNVNTNIVPSSIEGIGKFKIHYEVVSKESPISLSWVGICLFKLESAYKENFGSINLLEDPRIRNFLDDTVSHLSFFINNVELPSSSQIMEINDD